MKQNKSLRRNLSKKCFFTLPFLVFSYHKTFSNIFEESLYKKLVFDKVNIFTNGKRMFYHKIKLLKGNMQGSTLHYISFLSVCLFS